MSARRKTHMSCSLCETETPDDWTRHMHIGDYARIDYMGGNKFEWHTFFEGEQVFRVTAHECPMCGRELEEEES